MRKSISTKLITIFIAVTVLVVLITSIIFMYLFSDYAYSEKQTTLLQCANDIAALVEEDMSETNDRNFADYSRIVSGGVGASLWVVDTEGVFKNTSGSWPSHLRQLTDPEIDYIHSVFKGETVVTTDFSANFSEETMTVIVPVRIANSGQTQTAVIGAVFLHAPLSQINEMFRSSQYLLIFAVVVAVLVAAVVSTWFAFRFSRPVKDMCVAAGQMSRGNYAVRVECKEKNELSELSLSLNHLASALDNTIRQINAERDKLKSIIDNMSDGVATFDVNLSMTRYNSALLSICGKENFDTPEVRDAMLHVMKTGEKETVITEQDENILRFTMTRLHTHGEVDGVLMIVQDISQAERLEKMRREFVSNVSHEFRTPLTIIRGSVELLVDGAIEGEEEVSKCYVRIEREVAALERLVRDLLDVSRFKAGKISLTKKELDMNALLEDLTSTMQLIADDKHIRLLYKPVRIPTVVADYGRIRQLFIIFIDNAIKFTPENGVITLSASVTNKTVRIAIRDTGVGIAEEDIPFLFERFYKVDKSRGGSETGTGLGLSIAYQIVRLHGGDIEVNSKLGEGTCFTVVLPLPDGTPDVL